MVINIIMIFIIFFKFNAHLSRTYFQYSQVNNHIRNLNLKVIAGASIRAGSDKHSLISNGKHRGILVIVFIFWIGSFRKERNRQKW